MFARLFHTTNPIKIDAKVVSHGRYVAFQMAEGRHPTANVPGDFAIDRGTTTAAATNARVRRRSSRIQKHPTGGVRPNASENSQIKPSTVVRAARTAGSHPHLASWLPGTPQNRYYPRWSRSHPGNVGSRFLWRGWAGRTICSARLSCQEIHCHANMRAFAPHRRLANPG